MAASQTCVRKVYRTVMEDVVTNIRELFLDEGVDEQVLIELKQMWENKLMQSKAIDANDTPAEQPVPRQTHSSSDQRNSNVNAPSLSTSGMVQPTVLQYAPQVSNNDSQKTTLTLSMPPQHTISTANAPQKVTITLPAHMAHPGLPTVMSAPAATATLALPPEIAASLLQQPGTLAALNQTGIFPAQPHQNISISTGDNQRIQYQAVAVSQPNLPPTTAVGITSQPVQQPLTIASSQPNQQQKPTNLVQLDGTQDTSDEEEDDFQDDHQDDDDEQNDDENEDEGEEEEPLNSEDDVSDEDPSDLFDTDNVVVCQYDKITRCRNKWKFHLKDGIMSLKGPLQEHLEQFNIEEILNNGQGGHPGSGASTIFFNG